MRLNGEQLKRERQKKGINQEMLAEVLGLSQSMISMLEQGTRNVSWSTVEKMAVFIGCQPELITDNGEPSPYIQIMRDVKKLSDNQVEIVANLIKELCKKNIEENNGKDRA